MALSNLEIVKDLYKAFHAGDQKRIREIFDPNIIWVQNEGFPGGGVHTGIEAVFSNVFGKFAREWEVWRTEPRRWLDAGEDVIVLGEYHGTHETTGKSMKAAFAHVYSLRDGRVIRFEQYTDTVKVAEAVR
jgi:uncharacterized protein